MRCGERGVLSLGDTQQDELGCRTAREDCYRQKGIFSAKKFGSPPFVKKKTTQQQHLKLIPRVQL